MSSFPIVEITWRDAIGSDGWIDVEEIVNTEPTLHTQVGYLIQETKDSYKLCASFNEDFSNMGAYVVIPKTMVETIRQIDVTRIVLGTMDVDKSLT